MSLSKRKKNRRLLILFAAGLAVAALAPTAGAATATPERTATYTAPLVVDNAGTPGQIQSDAPDVVLAPPGVNVPKQPGEVIVSARVEDTSVPFVSEHARSQNRIDRMNSTPVETSSPNTFDWGDAGLGAGSAMALLLLTAAAALGIRRNQGRRVAL